MDTGQVSTITLTSLQGRLEQQANRGSLSMVILFMTEQHKKTKTKENGSKTKSISEQKEIKQYKYSYREV